MSATEPRLDLGFQRLRRAHRSERAPAALRRRTLERARPAYAPVQRPRSRPRSWLERRWPLALAAAIVSAAWVGVSRWVLDGHGGAGASPGAPAPANVVPRPEPAAPRDPVRGPCPKPLPPLWVPGPDDFPPAGTGLGMGVVATQTVCGPLNRRFLMQMQGRTGVAASSSVLIVLHDQGERAEQAPLTTRWWFGDLAQRERILLVYAHGGPRANDNPVPYDRSSVWQTDDDAHPAVDDFEYLQAIVDDLRARREGPRDVPPLLLASSSDVFLAGYGSGAVMALAAAARHPERYSGVAAFLPNRALRPDELDLEASARRAAGEHRLRSVLVVLRATSDGADEDAVAISAKWAAALGMDGTSARASRHDPGIVRIDSNLTGAVALRVLRLSTEVDPFPLPGGIGEARAASKARPFFFDGPGAAWEFFQQRN